MSHSIQLTYLVSTGLFIFALKWMNRPETARRGVLSGVAAMLLAVGGTLAMPGIVHFGDIAAAVILGTAVGIPLSRVPLTAVPQRTALSHAFGGLAAGLVGTAKYYLWLSEGGGELTRFRVAAIGAARGATVKHSTTASPTASPQRAPRAQRLFVVLSEAMHFSAFCDLCGKYLRVVPARDNRAYIRVAASIAMAELASRWSWIAPVESTTTEVPAHDAPPPVRPPVRMSQYVPGAIPVATVAVTAVLSRLMATKP